MEHQRWEASSHRKLTQISSARVRRQHDTPWGGCQAPRPQLLAMGFPSQVGLRPLSWCFASGKLKRKMIKDGRSREKAEQKEALLFSGSLANIGHLCTWVTSPAVQGLSSFLDGVRCRFGMNSAGKICDTMSKSDHSLPYAKFALEVSHQITVWVLLFN